MQKTDNPYPYLDTKIYHEVLFHDELKDVFYMITYIQNFIHNIFEQIEIARQSLHPANCAFSQIP